ncbi:MAG: non-ribosomal peptide synthetase [Aquabacterium sp.]
MFDSRDRRVHEQVLDRAAAMPQAIALICGDQRVRYAELADRATHIANGLRNRGMGQGMLIGVCLDRSPDMVASVLAVLMIGAAYLPIDPTDPISRILLTLDDALPGMVIAEPRVTGRLRHQLSPLPQSIQMASVDELASVASDPPAQAIAVSPDDRVYVIYTSGSTGRPKGVVMRHRAVENLIEWQIRSTASNRLRAGLSEASAPCAMQYTPLTFDVSFLEIFSTLASGRTLLIPADDEWRDLTVLLELTCRHNVGTMFLPLTALNLLADFAVRHQRFPHSLFEIMTGGEQLRITPNIKQWFSGMPWCTLQNIYGPTEAHMVTSHNLHGHPGKWPQLPPIGQAIDNVAIHILDEQLQPVQAGAMGEICISGVSLAEGYLNRPQQTAERFITWRGMRLYRTGDLGHVLADGSILYDGRLDDQVKIQGVRLELHEVEQLLDQHPDVQQCAVITRDTSGGKQLVAYVIPVSRGDGAPQRVDREAGWRDFLSARLPKTSVPGIYIPLDAFPLTSSGKVDRKALPPPSRRRPALSTPMVAPRTSMEQAIAAIWCECLELDEVGIDDGFFELGGKSLLLVRVQNTLSGALGREVPITRLLRNPSVRQLAADLTHNTRSDGASTADIAVGRRQRRQEAITQQQRGTSRHTRDAEIK